MRRWLSAFTVFSLLFMQLATAAHACPLVASALGPVQATPCAEMMMDASSPDPSRIDSPALCIKHCQPEPQGADAGHSAVLSAPAVVSMLLIVPVDESAGAMPMRLVEEAAQRATPPPPVSILHCCWRI